MHLGGDKNVRKEQYDNTHTPFLDECLEWIHGNHHRERFSDQKKDCDTTLP